MKKQDIIKKVARSEGIPAEEAEAVVDELLSLIRNRMRNGEETQIYGFGKFGVRWWKGRAGRDPQTGEEIEIDGRWIPYWSPSSTLVDETDPTQKAAAVAGKHAEKAGSTAKVAKIDSESPKSSPEETPVSEEADEKIEEQEVAYSDHNKEIPSAEATEESGNKDESRESEKDRWEEDAKEPETKPYMTFGEEEDSEGDSDWPDIGDEISMQELRFISERLKQASDENSTGLFTFDEDVEEEPEVPSEEKPESDTFPLVVEEESEHRGGWQAVERSPNRLGWSVILVLATALLAFGAYLAFNGDQGPVSPGDIPVATESGEQQEAQTGQEPSQPELTNQNAGSDTETSLTAADYEPYNFPAPQRDAFLDTYNTALEQFQAGNYSDAERILHRLLVSDPPEDYVDNLHYWLGESLFAREEYTESIREFEKVFTTPYMNKVEDALIMMGSAYIRLNQWEEARRILWKFPTQYPNSEHAALANRWIQEYQLGTTPPPVDESEAG